MSNPKKPRKLATKSKTGTKSKAAIRSKTPSKSKTASKSKTGGKSKTTSQSNMATRSMSARDAVAFGKTGAQRIDQRIRELGGWRGETLARMRALILEADPAITEEWKWSNPVWSHDGIVCTGEAYTKVVKLTFARGASVPDPFHLFNSSLEGNTRRAIDIREGEQVDAEAFKTLVKAAAAENSTRAKKTGTRA